MIANISTVISTCEQHIPNKIFQTGSAACKIDGDGDFTFRYTLWLSLNDADLKTRTLPGLKYPMGVFATSSITIIYHFVA